jgi:predicted DNA-binding transcriptional regulator AlpA
MSRTWMVTMTFAGAPVEAALFDIEDRLPWEGSVAAVPRREQFTITAAIEASEFEKAELLVTAEMAGLAHIALGSQPRVLGIETLDLDEFEKRADEPTLPELVSTPEVAAMLDVSRQRVHQLLAGNKKFPQPILRLGSGPLWVAEAVSKFNLQWERKPGRPARTRVVA